VDGLISFFGSYHAIRAETVLKRAAFAVRLIPGPKELSPNCGVALRFEYARRTDALALLAEHRVQIDGVHAYAPRVDQWNRRPSKWIARVKQWVT
jgi:putative Se/S carrier protein